MKNKEKYVDKMSEVFVNELDCDICDFKREKVLKINCGDICDVGCSECKEKTKKWLEEEYKEPIKLTHGEKVILENVDNRAKWVARDSYGDIYAYDVKPYKDGKLWENESWEFDLNIFKHLFNFVKWEDEEPYDIIELLENCEVVE